jgi:hypothetical protein
MWTVYLEVRGRDKSPKKHATILEKAPKWFILFIPSIYIYIYEKLRFLNVEKMYGHWVMHYFSEWNKEKSLWK